MLEGIAEHRRQIVDEIDGRRGVLEERGSTDRIERVEEKVGIDLRLKGVVPRFFELPLRPHPFKLLFMEPFFQLGVLLKYFQPLFEALAHLVHRLLKILQLQGPGDRNRLAVKVAVENLFRRIDHRLDGGNQTHRELVEERGEDRHDEEKEKDSDGAVGEDQLPGLVKRPYVALNRPGKVSVERVAFEVGVDFVDRPEAVEVFDRVQFGSDIDEVHQLPVDEKDPVGNPFVQKVPFRILIGVEAQPMEGDRKLLVHKIKFIEQGFIDLARRMLSDLGKERSAGIQLGREGGQNLIASGPLLGFLKKRKDDAEKDHRQNEDDAQHREIRCKQPPLEGVPWSGAFHGMSIPSWCSSSEREGIGVGESEEFRWIFPDSPPSVGKKAHSQ